MAKIQNMVFKKPGIDAVSIVEIIFVKNTNFNEVKLAFCS